MENSSYVKTLVMEVSTRCDSKCLLCERNIMTENIINKTMNFDQFKKILDQFENK